MLKTTTATPALDRIKELTKACVGHQYLYFDKPALLRNYSMWAACISPSNTLHLMDNNLMWWMCDSKDEPYLQDVLKTVEAAAKKYV